MISNNCKIMTVWRIKPEVGRKSRQMCYNLSKSGVQNFSNHSVYLCVRGYDFPKVFQNEIVHEVLLHIP